MIVISENEKLFASQLFVFIVSLQNLTGSNLVFASMTFRLIKGSKLGRNLGGTQKTMTISP